MGIRPYDPWELEKDSEFMEEIRQECEKYGGTIEDTIANYIEDYYKGNAERIAHNSNNNTI